MKINRLNFLKQLNSVKAGLASKEVIDQSTYFVFVDGQVITFNDEVAVHANLDDGVDITGAIPAKELLAVLTKFKGEEVDISLDENEIRLKCGKSRSGIKLASEISLPISEIKIPEEWAKLPEDFIEGLLICSPSASRDLSYPVLTGININGNFAEATNNHKITRWDWGQPSDFVDTSILIPAAVVKDLAKFSPDLISTGSGWVHFMSKDDVVLSCRTISGDFPDLSGFLDLEVFATFEFPATINDILDKAGVFVSANDDLVNIEIDEKGLMTIRGEGDFGWYEENCRVKWDGGENTRFAVHPLQLQSTLRNSRKAELNENSIRFTTDSFIHVVALEAM